jgi:biotin transport system substrate-specific component
VLSALTELQWAFIGLLLTIGGTFLEAFITSPPWTWGQDGIQTYSLGVTYQIGAVLLVSCLGGKNAAVLSQIGYLALGLVGFPIFTQGGGLGYFKEPTFGYILGFLPGAWVCGSIAFMAAPRLETLTFGCLCGLLTVHAVGLCYLVYLVLSQTFNQPLWQAVVDYSIHPLPGQLAVACAAAVLAFILRRLMFY